VTEARQVTEARPDAQQILEQSRIGQAAAAARAAVAASIAGARSAQVARLFAAMFLRFPVSQRAAFVMVMLAVAVIVHVLAAGALPVRSRPTVTLTAPILLAIACGLVAASIPRRQ
jgi:hypothetical protein